MRTPSLMSPTAGSDSIATCIRAAALAAASGFEKSAITESPMVLTTRPPVASADRRRFSRQRPMASAASASPAASYSFVLPVTSANRTVVRRLASANDVSTNRLRSPDPAVAPVARVSACPEVVLAQLRKLVAAVAAGLGISGIVQGRLKKVRDARLVILRHRLVRGNAGRQLVEPRRIEAEDLALVLRGELRIAVLFRHLLRDLEAPEGLDLPLRRAVPERIRAEHDALRPHVLHELPQHVRAHARERYDARGERGADLGVHVLQRRRGLRELGEPAQVGNVVAQLLGADRLQRFGIEEARAEAGVVDDEVELRPVARHLRQVGRAALLGRVRRGRREALVNADVEEARMGRELLAVVTDQLEARVRDLLVVEPPLLQLALGIVVELRGVGDVVALPRVGMELVDLLLHEAQVLPAREDLPVREQPRRAGDGVDPVPHGRGLVAGEVHRGERLVDAARDARLGAARRLEQAERRIAQDRDRHLAVEIDILDELYEVEVRAGDRRLAERRIPRAPGTPELIGQALGVERILVEAGGRSRVTGALGHG